MLVPTFSEYLSKDAHTVILIPISSTMHVVQSTEKIATTTKVLEPPVCITIKNCCCLRSVLNRDLMFGYSYSRMHRFPDTFCKKASDYSSISRH